MKWNHFALKFWSKSQGKIFTTERLWSELFATNNFYLLLSSAFLAVLLLSSEKNRWCCHSFFKRKLIKTTCFFVHDFTMGFIARKFVLFWCQRLVSNNYKWGTKFAILSEKNIFCLHVTHISSAELKFMHKKSWYYRLVQTKRQFKWIQPL